MNSKRLLLIATIIVAMAGLRAASSEAALFTAAQNRESVRLPRSVRLREVRGRGLLADVWINSTGPFLFAVDTGAGATLLSPRVAAASRAELRSGRRTISGLSGRNGSAQEATIQALAVGNRENYLPGSRNVVVTAGLPADLDGVLDPTEAFSPFGYVIDVPHLELSAFDPYESPVAMNYQPRDGAVVPWLQDGHGRRPFVQLDNGDRALIDTGSSLGLAIRSSAAIKGGPVSYSRDVGGGSVSVARVRPTTISIGPMMLRNIPTDLVSGAEVNAPVLLGLSALRPFRLRFDPVHRLIEIAPANTRARS